MSEAIIQSYCLSVTDRVFQPRFAFAKLIPAIGTAFACILSVTIGRNEAVRLSRLI